MTTIRMYQMMNIRPSMIKTVKQHQPIKAQKNILIRMATLMSPTITIMRRRNLTMMIIMIIPIHPD